MVVKLPLIIYEGYDVFLFSSVKMAEDYLEPIDIKAHVYCGFDSEGRPLKFSVIRQSLGWRHCFAKVEQVVIGIDEVKPKQETELRKVLLTLLTHAKAVPKNAEELALSELVELSLPHALIDW